MVHGMIIIHSAPRALTPHLEWAVSGVLGVPARFRWSGQPASDRSTRLVRAEARWSGTEETGALLATALRGFEDLRYEIVQDQTATTEGARWMHTPALGIFYCPIDLAGNTLVPENRITSALETHRSDPRALREALDLALGTAWDDELDTFRELAGEQPSRRLHAVS
jgi:hypothetical protein